MPLLRRFPPSFFLDTVTIESLQFPRDAQGAITETLFQAVNVRARVQPTETASNAVVRDNDGVDSSHGRTQANIRLQLPLTFALKAEDTILHTAGPSLLPGQTDTYRVQGDTLGALAIPLIAAIRES